MHYLLMIHADEGEMSSMKEVETSQMMVAMNEFDADLPEAGQNLGSLRLEPSSTARTVKVRKQKTIVTDGPSVETKEQLGGVYLVEVDSLVEAVGIAERLSTATFATVEVRGLGRS